MSTQRNPEFVEDELSEHAVREYLESHPEFFEHNAEILDTIKLPHATGGTVSLVERQVSRLRQQELRMQRRLNELVEVARDNDVISAKIHKFTLQLLASRDLQASIDAIEEAMRSGFNADHAVLVHFGDPALFADIESGRFFRAIPREDVALKPFETFLNGNAPRCGRARDSQCDFLFHGDAQDIGSVALVPLGNKASIGFLAIGSVDANRFHPGMSIDFLARVGDLVAGALRRF